MKKVFLALAIMMAVTVTSCKKVVTVEPIATDTVQVDSVQVDTVKTDTVRHDTLIVPQTEPAEPASK
jgi:hypothetical protein